MNKLESIVAGTFGRVVEYGKKINNKRLVSWALALVTMFSMSGCTLAVETADGEEQSRDPMIGVFITTEDLTMLDFDWDAYFEENIGDIVNGKEADIQASVDAEKRIYATVDKHDSTDPIDWEVSFGDLEGLSFFNALWQYGDGQAFTMMTLSDEICDIAHRIKSTDNEEELELEGTIYILPAMYDTIYYVNPVYQTQAGDIYVTPGGWGDHIGSPSIGAKLTITMEDEVTVTENGLTKTNKTTIILTYQGAYEPTKILVHQMDANNGIVKTEEYAPGTLPEEIKTEKEAAYIIVETQIDNPDNANDCVREIYTYNELGDTYFETFLVTEDGGLGKMTTRIEWK